MTISIIKAKQSDIKEIYKIMDSCTEWLSNKKLDYWEGVYSLEKLKRRINKNIIYILRDNSKIIGTITLTKERSSYYTDKDNEYFKDPNGKAVYILGLAISPKYMKKGFATKLIEYAENRTKQEGIKYIRFEIFSNDIDLTKFYQNRGYVIVGTRKIIPLCEFHFFEKCL